MLNIAFFVRQNITESWGGLPVVLRDDYQLLLEKSVEQSRGKQGEPSSRLQAQLLKKRGYDIFINGMNQRVFHLMKNYRIKNEKFRALLKKYGQVKSLGTTQGI